MSFRDRIQPLLTFFDEQPQFGRYAFALGCGLVAALLRHVMDPIFGDGFPYIFAYPTATLVALLAGFLPGMVSVLVCAAGVWFFNPSLGHPAGVFGQGLYVVSDGLIVWVASEYRSLTQNFAHQAATRRKAAHYTRSLIEASLDPLVMISVGGKITDANQAAEMATGAPRDRLVGSDFSAYFTEPEKAEVIYLEAFSKGLIRDCPLTLQRSPGETTEVLCNASVYLDEKGNVAGVFASAHDITERRRAEAEIANRTAELRAANTELDSFAYAVSHDLRAPLRAMIGFSEALVQDYGDRLDGEARVYLDQITIASRKMGELVDGLLTLSRGTRGELKREALNISAIAERLLADQVAATPNRKVSWSVEPGMHARGDALMVEVVMRNLIDNAWKYTGKASDPTIRVYTEELDDQEWFCVSDNGAGFDESHANKLFKPFQRLHRQEEFPGVGIGLATAQRIIHRHGGMIRAEGSRGNGAKFCFTLPNHAPAGTETS